MPVTRPPPQDLNITGEEVYQRRIAMSTGFKPASQTTSLASVASAVDSAGTVPVGAPVLPATAETGEEAYLRRVAMSQGPPAPPSQPAPVQPPAITGDEAYQRRVALSSQQVPMPPPPQQQPSEPSDSPGYNSFTQSVPPPPSSITSATSAGDVPDFEERVRNSRNAAAAIAAKFSAFESPGEVKDSSEPAPEESGPGPSTRYASWALIYHGLTSRCPDLILIRSLPVSWQNGGTKKGRVSVRTAVGLYKRFPSSRSRGARGQTARARARVRAPAVVALSMREPMLAQRRKQKDLANRVV